jgi:hypothetical protein
MVRLSAISLLTAALLAAAISPEGARAVAAVNAELDAVRQNPEFAAGRNPEGARVHLRDVDRTIRNCTTQLRLLIRDSREPEVKAAQQRVAQLTAYADSIRSALQKGGNSSGQQDQLAYDFVKTHLSSGILSRGAALGELARNPESTVSLGGDIPTMNLLREQLAVIDADCKGKFAPVASAPHPSPGMQHAAPGLWCAIAADRDTYLRRSATNVANNELQGVVRILKEMTAQLESREGYLETELVMVGRALWRRDELLQELSKRHKPVFDAVGVTDTSKLLAPLDPAINALQAEAKRLAPNWKIPASGPHDAGPEALARQQVSREFPGSAVRSTLMTDEVFRIRKNSLGIPLDRSKSGHILYKSPNEQLCRQQTFEYTEVFQGNGYQKPAGVRLHRLRYLNCP